MMGSLADSWLELAFKAENQKLGHDLINAYNALEDDQKVLTPEELKALRSANRIYIGKGFEYSNPEQALDAYSQFPNLASLDEVAKKLIHDSQQQIAVRKPKLSLSRIRQHLSDTSSIGAARVLGSSKRIAQGIDRFPSITKTTCRMIERKEGPEYKETERICLP
jgi:hypothetical protein